MLFQIAGIAILLVFYGCYLAKMASQRQKGIKTDQIGKGKSGYAKFIEMTMKLATYLVLAVEVVSIALRTAPFCIPVRIAGLFAGSIGVTIFIISVLTMRDSWRAGVSKTDQTELVTKGIYRISRNPAFLGFDLVYVGMMIMFFNWPLFLVSVFAILMLHLQIVNVEEEFLLEAFGDEYLCYRKTVCRYLGRKRSIRREEKQ